MYRCDVCGHTNRSGARFCCSCAAPLTPPQAEEAVTQPLEPARIRPTLEDERWLAATLMQGESSSSVSQQAVGQTRPLSPHQGDIQEKAMDQSQSATPERFDGRYEVISSDEQGNVEVRDQEPWQCCWSCGSTENNANDGFCTNCGAALTPRTYTGMLTPRTKPGSLALVASIEDDGVRDMLPPIQDVVETDEHILVIPGESLNNPIPTPLDELAAMQVGASMAHLLGALHQHGLVVGQLSPDKLGLTPDGQLRLLQVPNLRQIDDESERDSVILHDLKSLAGLLEAITDTPRTTQRLSEGEALTVEALLADDSEEQDFVLLLRQMRTGMFHSADALAEHLDLLIAERTRPRALRQKIGAVSDTGIVRDHNEDSLLALNLNLNNTSQDYTRGLYIVADGMGGHAAGEVASGRAVRSAADVILKEYMSQTLDPETPFDPAYAQDILARAVLHANDAVRHTGISYGNDMGTTITMALVVGDRAVIANVGDSRTYLYRDGQLRRISQDHSLVMRLVELGQITEEDIYVHPQRNAVLRSLGDTTDLEVDLFEAHLLPGDALLLCSDGQWEMTHDPDMEYILQKFAEADEQHVCQELVNAANQAGGEDNITSILVRFETM